MDTNKGKLKVIGDFSGRMGHVEKEVNTVMGNKV